MRSSRCTRRPLVVVLVALAPATAGLAVSGGAAAQADAFPARKAGLWEMRSSGGPLGGSQRMQQCIDARTDDMLREQSAGRGQDCDKPKVSRKGTEYETEVVCRREGVTTTMRGRYTMQGDSAYSGTMRMRFDPALNGMSEMNMAMEGRWMGRCRAGMKPGDVVMDGVPRTNLLNRDGAAPSRMSQEQLKSLREEMERRMGDPAK
jgi:hypothetical protein